jgi:type I restriction enzyme R subunit
MTQAKLDGATVDWHYENRLAKVHLDEGILDQIDKEVANIEVQGLTPGKIEKLKKDLVTMEAVIGDDRLNLVVDDILAHYDIRKDMLKGKALIVTYSRKIAYRMYQLIKEKSPEIGSKIGLVLGDSNKDTNQEMRDLIGNKQHRQTLANQFKDENSEFILMYALPNELTTWITIVYPWMNVSFK